MCLQRYQVYKDVAVTVCYMMKVCPSDTLYGHQRVAFMLRQWPWYKAINYFHLLPLMSLIARVPRSKSDNQLPSKLKTNMDHPERRFT